MRKVQVSRLVYVCRNKHSSDSCINQKQRSSARDWKLIFVLKFITWRASNISESEWFPNISSYSSVHATRKNVDSLITNSSRPLHKPPGYFEGLLRTITKVLPRLRQKFRLCLLVNVMQRTPSIGKTFSDCVGVHVDGRKNENFPWTRRTQACQMIPRHGASPARGRNLSFRPHSRGDLGHREKHLPKSKTTSGVLIRDFTRNKF